MEPSGRDIRIMSFGLPKRSPHVHKNFPVPVPDIHDPGFIRLVSYFSDLRFFYPS